MVSIISNLGIVFLIEFLDVVGVIIITSGALWCIGRYMTGILGMMPIMSNDQMRLTLGKSIVLAVEFMLAADIIKTIANPDFYQIGILGALVVIRTVLTYFLNLELVQIQEKI